MPSIHLFTDKISYQFRDHESLISWIKLIVEGESKRLGDINLIITSDEELLKINKIFLHRDYLTDTISFPSSVGDRISGEAYLSLDRIVDNATILGVDEEEELHRVIVHSVLHLIGYGDSSDSEKLIMRAKEDFYLNLRPV